MNPVEEFIRRYKHQFEAERREKFVHAGGRGMIVKTPGEKILHLPNGATVRVSTDASGCATQVEEDEHMHAIARPRPIRMKLAMMGDDQ